jgi:hypothetical protein
MLELPEYLVDGNFHTILACAGKLYAIVSCTDLVTEQWNTYVMEVKEEDSKFDIMQHLFQRNVRTSIKACTVQDSRICILAKKVGENPNAKGRSTTFFVFDTATNTTYDHSEGANWGTLMIPMEDEIVVTEMGHSSCSRYSFDTCKWKHTKEQFLPFPLPSFERRKYSSISDGDNFYFFGTRYECLDFPPIIWSYMYNFTEKKWQNMPGLPQPQQESAFCRVKLPIHLSKCHLDCPHCRHSDVTIYGNPSLYSRRGCIT